MESKPNDYDSLLLNLLQKQENISSFLRVIFDFLYRRTDYFRIMHTDFDSVGFKPGVAKKMLLQEFTTYKDKADEDQRMRTYSQQKKAKDSNVPDVGRITEITTDDADSGDTPSISDARLEPADGDNKPSGSAPLRPPARPLTECYNGAVRDDYWWSQTRGELEVRIPVPDSITKGRQLRCDIKRGSVAVSADLGCGGGDDGRRWSPVVSGDLQWDVVAEECVWTLDPAQHVLLLTLEKRVERMWSAVLVGEAPIPLDTVDNSTDIAELDQEARMKVHQLMYDERQRRDGKPTSEQQKMSKMMEQAWDAEGSPFKGQPFDATKLNISGNTISFNGPAAAP